MRTVRSVTRACRTAILATGLCAAAAPLGAQPVRPRGEVFQHFTSYLGQLDPVTLDLGGTPVSTGPLTLTLDPRQGAKNMFYMNLDEMYAEYELDLLVDAPLLHALGAPQQAFNLVAAGPIASISPSLVVPNTVQDFQFDIGPLTAAGLFASSQLFADWSYSNLIIIINSPGAGVSVDAEVTPVKTTQPNTRGNPAGKLKTPSCPKPKDPRKPRAGGRSAPQSAGRLAGALSAAADASDCDEYPITGSITGTLNPVPEPATMALLASGLAGIGAAGWTRRKSRGAA